MLFYRGTGLVALSMNKIRLLVVLFALVLAACGQQDAENKQSAAAPNGGTQLSDEQLVAQRATDRWQALITGDMEKAYGYLSPGTRRAMTLPVYTSSKAIGPARFKDAVVESAKCEDQVCTLKLQITYIYVGSISAMQGQESSSVVTEKWIAAEDNWFHVPD